MEAFRLKESEMRVREARPGSTCALRLPWLERGRAVALPAAVLYLFLSMLSHPGG